MKSILRKKAFWQSILTTMVLGVYAFIAMSTLGGTTQQKFQLPDGRWEVSRYLSNGKNETTTGNVDDRGRFEGPVTVVYEKDFTLRSTEEVNMIAGLRHGTSKVTYAMGNVSYWCYEHGSVVKEGRCDEKAFAYPLNGNSAYQIFSGEYPWLAFKMDAFGFDSNYLKAFLDTLETILYSNVFIEEEFDTYYEDAIAILSDTPYDSIIQLNSMVTLFNGMDLILSHQFRLATLDSYIDGDSNTYSTTRSVYSNYLLDLSAAGVSESDFEGFCGVYDGIMSGYDPISPDDPYLLDSLDSRMYRAMDSISSGSKKSGIETESLKAKSYSDKLRFLNSSIRGYLLGTMKQTSAKTPAEVSEIVVYSFLIKLIEGDYIRKAVKEAYNVLNGIVSLPTVVTNFTENISSTAVSLSGNVLEDGGGEITSRGIAWGMVYNPTIDDQILQAGTGKGDFTANLTGLTEGETYFVRAFASNSAGTAYGNCISFVAGGPIGVNYEELKEMEVKVYPNPANQHVTVTFAAEEAGVIIFTMFDLSGKNVLRKSFSAVKGENSIHINVSDIKNGFYTFNIEGEKNQYKMQKLLIER
jgi:hypothetical protein